MYYFKAFIGAYLGLAVVACDTGSKDSQPSDKIRTTDNLPVSIKLEATQFPSKPQSASYTSISQSDFVDGVYGQDLVVGEIPPGFDASAEAANAVAEGTFQTLPGFRFSIKPMAPIKVTLSARGRLQAIKKETDTKTGFLAVSLGEFPEVYPPSFREKYDLTLSSLPGSASPFTFTYSFIARRDDQSSIFMNIVAGDSGNKLLFARNVDGFVVSRVSTAGLCDTCILSVNNVSVRQTVKTFSELPALPVSGKMRITDPARFSGVLTKQTDYALTAYTTGSGTGTIAIKTNIVGANTTAKPWCHESEGALSSCVVPGPSGSTPTYFMSLNAVPQNLSAGLLGGTSGVLSYYLAGTISVTVKRDGVSIETRTLNFYSDPASVLSIATIPTWALDDVRAAAVSGRPEYPIE